MSTHSDALTHGLRYHQTGQLDQAQQIYRDVVAADPANADAWSLLGAVCINLNRLDEAYAAPGRGPAPQSPASRGPRQPGRAAGQAGPVCRRDRQLPPRPGGPAQPGQHVHEPGQRAGAQWSDRPKPSRPCARRLNWRPTPCGPTRNCCGCSLRKAAWAKPSTACARSRACSLLTRGHSSNRPPRWHKLAASTKPWPAIAKHLRLKPDTAEAMVNLGSLHSQRGELDEAVSLFRQALQLRPRFAEAYTNLGRALTRQGKLVEAATALEEAIRLKPELSEAHNNLGVARAGGRTLRRGRRLLPPGPGLEPRQRQRAVQPGHRAPDAADGGHRPRMFRTSARPATRPGGSPPQSLRRVAVERKLRRGLRRIRMAVPPARTFPATNLAGRCGTAGRWPARPSCCATSRAWATRFNSSVTPRWCASGPTA